MIDLASTRIDTAVPFRLALEMVGSGQREFICEQLLRVLPGRRVVVRARLEDGHVVLKLFIGNNAAKYYRRELCGLGYLEAAGVAVPERIGLVTGADVRGIVSRYLARAEPVAPADRAAVEDVVRLLGKLHGAGMRHADLHLDNFIRTDQQTFAIDGDGIRRTRGPLAPAKSLDDLGVLLAQRPPALDAEAQALGTAYCGARGWVGDPAWQARLEVSLADRRAQRVSRFLAKTLRDCTEFAVSDGWRERRVVVRTWREVLGAALDAPDDWLESGQRLKSGNSATVARVADSAGRSWVLKRYNVKSPIHRLLRQLKRTPRWRNAWLAGQRLRFLEIPVARPVALLERKLGFLRGIAYLVMEDFGDLDLAAEVGSSGLSERRLQQVTNLFKLLRQVGLTHSDTKATNFLIAGDQVHLIDLDGMQPGPGGFQADLQRFLDNWAGDVRRRFQTAFAEAGLLE